MYWEATVDAKEFISYCQAPSCEAAWFERPAGVVSVLSIGDAESTMKAAAGVVMEEGDDMFAALLILGVGVTGVVDDFVVAGVGAGAVAIDVGGPSRRICHRRSRCQGVSSFNR